MTHNEHSAAGEINLSLHRKQALALETQATEVLYGGAAGGGKSHLMRVAAIIWCAAISGLQVYIFRRLFPDLIKNHMEGPKGFRALLSPWERAGFVKIVEEEIRFWNGSRIYQCHCKDEQDRFKYQGAEIHVLMIDELTHFTDVVYRFLRGRTRMVGLNLPAAYVGKFPRILCGSNPGNVGHQWVKAAFVDAPEYALRAMGDDEGGMLRQYIPARLNDNPSMTDDDPAYRARLRGLGSDALVRAMEDGDWDVVAGAYFPEFSRKDHVIKPFAIPAHWLRFASFDWGSARPFSVGWWAISDGDLQPDGRQYPTGAMVRYREWYGASAPNVGLQMTAEEVADGMKQREMERVSYRVADPACFKRDGGPSIAERMLSRGITFQRADNSRIAGWDQMRDRLRGDDGYPMLYVFETCQDFIRTVPALQHDEARLEDVDSDGEDHAGDECFAAGTLIATERGDVPIERVGLGDRVLTRQGYRRVLAAFSVGIRPVFTVRLSGGASLTGTVNHPVWVDGQGFIPLGDLRYGCIMRPWNTTPTNTARSRAAYGGKLMVLSRRAISSTTKIMTTAITRSVIWNALRRLNIASTIRACCPKPHAYATTAGMNSQALFGHRGIVQMPANRPCVGSNGWTMRRAFVPDAAQSSEPIGSSRCSIAPWLALIPAHMSALWSRAFARIAARDLRQRTAERFGVPTVVGRPVIAGLQRVYNLSVEGAEEYFASGVLVHNCRYACMSRPYTRRSTVVEPIRGITEMTYGELSTWHDKRHGAQSRPQRV